MENIEHAAISPLPDESQTAWHIEANHMKPNQMPDKEMSHNSYPRHTIP
jgi:hypothetical protein